ncbi:MAG TPA: FAD-binding protein [Propionibacteriaceae bacterium]|nr:FAD-binding protein [Propionibacteriaceae bacterium]
MDATFDHTFDVVVVGSGAAAFAAAIAAADRGLGVVMIEGSDRWGGSTAMSGGGLWLPNNPLMRRAGAADSRDEALAYMEQTVGNDAGPAASAERRAAFVDGVDGLVEVLERLGVRFARAADYPDYYPELPGGKIGRALEVEPFDVAGIGSWWESSRGQDGLPAPVKTDDFWLLQRGWSSPGGFFRGARVAKRVATMVIKREHLVGMGAALSAALLAVAQPLGVDLWLSTPLTGLIVEDGRVVGVRATRGSRDITIGATAGVVLGGGGFDHNRMWRERYHGVSGDASSGSRSNLGSVIAVAERAGAALDLMDDAWWGASVPPVQPEGTPAFLVSERSMPHSIIVDAVGRRFANESESYVDLGHHMLGHAAKGRFWLVADARHAHRYLRSYALDPRMTRAMAKAGVLHRADTLTALAGSAGMHASVLEASVARFNGFARTGIDHDFHRGDSAYDRYYGDPLCHPNPNLGTLEKPPFTAIELVPGDLGTKGGVVTDADARVLRADGSAIEGLYAAGNCSASVMGRTYPGPGATLGAATVFGHLAALHLAGASRPRPQPAGVTATG